jgi:hypothetical protein
MRWTSTFRRAARREAVDVKRAGQRMRHPTALGGHRWLTVSAHLAPQRPVTGNFKMWSAGQWRWAQRMGTLPACSWPGPDVKRSTPIAVAASIGRVKLRSANNSPLHISTSFLPADQLAVGGCLRAP